MFEPVMQIWNNLSSMYKGAAGLALVVVLYFLYSWYQRRSSEGYRGENFNQRNSSESSGNLTCTMYYVEWCKFCKKAKPEWEKLVSELDGKVINGKKIVVNSINCDENEEVAEKENIKGYPTFKFNMDGKYIDYPDAPSDYNSFQTFIRELVGGK
jgi:thiol-disulfide isomerase/thioredoxin